MVFTTTLFTFLFFPASVLLFFAGMAADAKFTRLRAGDVTLVALSFLFFSWNNFQTAKWLFAFVGFVYVFGLLIEQSGLAGNERLSNRALAAGVFILVLMLGCYKYRGFTFEIINSLFHWNVAAKKIAVPLGLSFLTFSAVSYLADIRTRKARAGTFLDCALYLSFFPKIISGPIVLWRDFSPQIARRAVNADDLYDGVNKICVGFAKKAILADLFGGVIAAIDASYAASGIDAPTAWLAVVLYWLQIYFDFSGYSDIAAGAARIFGFRLPENFNYPYVSTSIAEFWRRWHISLGAWFREYVYFPLGGSRTGRARTVFNLAVVFALTGVWHGAGWNYILWGAINGMFVIFDNLMKENKIWKRVPHLVKWFLTTTVVVAFWELFRFSTVTKSYSWLCVMIGRKVFSDYTFGWQYFLTPSVAFFAAVGFICAVAPGVISSSTRGGGRWLPVQNKRYIIWLEALHGVLAVSLFVLAVIFIVNSSYRPFIYFQY